MSGELKENIYIRRGQTGDLDALAALEAACFPPAEAATAEQLKERLDHYAGHFWLLFRGEQLIAFIDGFVTDEPDLRDEMYENAGAHQEDGAWQMIFGLNTHPDDRRHGYAGLLIKRMIEDAREQGRKGLVLTCKEALIPYYRKFGFADEGVSASVHGGVTWYQMRLRFTEE